MKEKSVKDFTTSKVEDNVLKITFISALLPPYLLLLLLSVVFLSFWLLLFALKSYLKLRRHLQNLSAMDDNKKKAEAILKVFLYAHLLSADKM